MLEVVLAGTPWDLVPIIRHKRRSGAHEVDVMPGLYEEDCHGAGRED